MKGLFSCGYSKYHDLFIDFYEQNKEKIKLVCMGKLNKKISKKEYKTLSKKITNN